MKIIDKKEFENFVDRLIEKGDKEIVGVQEKGEKFVFDRLEKAEDLRLDYDVTILPPKKYFMPQRETLVEYKTGNEVKMEAVNEVIPRVIIGIHPYDLEAIKQMDKVFADTPEDHNYLEKRKNSVLIGVNMQRTSERCFAGSMGTATIEDGYDLMLTDLGGKYAVEIGSSKGNEFLDKGNAEVREAEPEEVEEVEKAEEELRDRFEKELNFSPEKLPWLLAENYDNDEFWEKNAEDCYSCGTCNLVCPTCYCFDVQDLNEITLDEGERIRQWDGCMLEAFAEVAGGENFREERAERYRHRYMRKGRYLYNMFGDIACVGCGRCSSQCVPDIADPTEIFNKLMEGKI
ncbi:MAG: 4Fe-4S dicluster domain-containing protein [Candidatus Natronoplasma sp.]